MVSVILAMFIFQKKSREFLLDDNRIDRRKAGRGIVKVLNSYEMGKR